MLAALLISSVSAQPPADDGRRVVRVRAERFSFTPSEIQVKSGEEIEFRYSAAALAPLEPGWTRRFVLEARGWCKDMDLYTKDGETVAPLPASEPPRDPTMRDELHRRFNTRYESGK